MSRPLVSVAVATVSRPDRLRICLESIVAGRTPPSEVVVVDQGDDPRTVEAVRHLADGDVPLRHLRHRSRGLAASRNAALQSCSGDIMAVTDDDCRADPGWIESIVDAFVLFPEIGAVTGRVLADGVPADGHAVSLRTGTTPRTFTEPTDPWSVGTGANFAIRREVAIAHGGYDERLGAGSPGRAAEDLELIHRLLRAGRPIRYEPAALIFHARQSDERRRASRWGYGYGIGAFCGISMRRRDRASLGILRHWAAMRARLLKTGAGQRDLARVREELIVLCATVAGIGYGLRAGRASATE